MKDFFGLVVFGFYHRPSWQGRPGVWNSSNCSLLLPHFPREQEQREVKKQDQALPSPPLYTALTTRKFFSTQPSPPEGSTVPKTAPPALEQKFKHTSFLKMSYIQIRKGFVMQMTVQENLRTRRVVALTKQLSFSTCGSPHMVLLHRLVVLPHSMAEVGEE